MREFREITPCGECCTNCSKRVQGACRGCRETDGHCEEWAQSGGCPVYACTKEHGILFCGVCPEFPCDHLPMMKWRPDCVRELTELAEQYREWLLSANKETSHDHPLNGWFDQAL